MNSELIASNPRRIVRIQINGEQREFPKRFLSLNELITMLSLAPQRIAVEVNKKIVRRSDWETTKLKDGDQIEIVHFVGGGNSTHQHDFTRCRVRWQGGVRRGYWSLVLNVLW